jgi:Fungal protein kinase
VRGVLAEQKFQHYLKDSPVTKLEVYDEESKTTNDFIVGASLVDPFSMLGRATKVYVAVEKTTGQTVLLKDCWRVDLPDIEQEGKILKRLNAVNVKNIPLLLYAGDVAWPKSQITKSMALINSSWRFGNKRLTPHTHYRQVVDVVGRPLHTFRSSKELVQVIYDAFQG